MNRRIVFDMWGRYAGTYEDSGTANDWRVYNGYTVTASWWPRRA